MRLLVFLNEIEWKKTSNDFSPKEASISRGDPYTYKLIYKTLGLPYEFLAEIDPHEDFDENNKKTWFWNVEFGNINSTGDVNTNSLTAVHKEDGIDPTKDELDRFPYMFGNVQKCLELFVKHRKVGGIRFSGGDKYLTKLYSRAATKAAIEQATKLKFSVSRSSTNNFWFTTDGK